MSARDRWVGAVCREVDPDLWFPPKGGDTRPARRLCGSCPVQVSCLEYVLDHEEHLLGVWGGTTERARRKMRAQRGTARPTGRPRREAA